MYSGMQYDVTEDNTVQSSGSVTVAIIICSPSLPVLAAPDNCWILSNQKETSPQQSLHPHAQACCSRLGHEVADETINGGNLCY